MLTKAAREARKEKYQEADASGLIIVQRVEKYNVSKKDSNFEIFDDICSHSRALFNSVSYYYRDLWRQGRNLPTYLELDEMCKNPSKELEHWREHYQALPAQAAQQVLIQFKQAWDSYFKAVKAYRIDPSKFTGEPQIPGFIKRRNLVTTPQSFSVKDGFLRFLKKKQVLPIKLYPGSKYAPECITQIKIIPMATCYQVIVIYETKIGKVAENVINLSDQDRRILGIDLGVNNFLACANNIGLMPFVIDGSGIKSLNQHYNKVKANKQAKLPYYYGLETKDLDFIGPRKLQKKQQQWSKHLNIITQNRTKTLNDYLHKIARFVVDYCLDSKIDTVVAGYNTNWKQEINLGTRNNQNFTYVPHRRFLDILTYKLQDAGIYYQETDEAYTSKCSFLDDEPMQHHDHYLGVRLKRGLFRSAKGILINADVNGALNIIRKVYPKAFDVLKARGSRGCGLHPIKLKTLCELSYKPQDLVGVSGLEVLKKFNTSIYFNKKL